MRTIINNSYARQHRLLLCHRWGAHADAHGWRGAGPRRHPGGQPSARVAEPVEIANLGVFLASDQASYGTAKTNYVDGGLIQGSVGL
jgi:NAD(P)-dependent dehydrogenase (short-subunit alcohol dehydrogenase family)